MSFIGNMFKKKEDPIEGLKRIAGQEMQDPSMMTDPFPDMQEMPQDPMQTDSFGNIKRNPYEQDVSSAMPSKPNIEQAPIINTQNKDMEIIIAKLDTIRAEISNMNHRLDRLEQQKPSQPKYRW